MSISAQMKYYLADPGLRNARLDFRQIEETHLMENIIFNELKVQGFGVDVGIVESFEKNAVGNGIRKQLEIDFMANRGRERYYVQSALNIDDPDKAAQEKRILAFHAECCRFARKRQRRNLRFKGNVLDHLNWYS